MGIMEKMRSSTAPILWLLIISFGLLWVLADTQVFDAIALGPRSLGEVNGDPITLEEYNNRVSFYNEQFSMQTNQSIPIEMRAMYENQAWEDLVAARLIRQKMDELGITVTDNELIDMIAGPNPDPFIYQQFADESGNIDRIALQAAIDAPENSLIWITIEQQLRDNRRQQKMGNFISSGLKVSELDIRNEYIRENSFADIRYVRFPYSEISDEEISVTDSELRDYYNSHRDEYRRGETYRFRYVSWDKTPTASDTLNTVREMENLRDAFEATENDSLFLSSYSSQTPYNGSFVSRDELREEYAPVLELEPGEVSEVVIVNGDPHMFKLIEERDDEIRFAVFSYGVDPEASGTSYRLAEQAGEFEFYASTEGFESEADRHDLEIREATATKDNPFIPGLGSSLQLLNVLENMRVNRIADPVELSDQFVVVQLLEKIPEGPRPFEEVRSQVENGVKTEKRRQIVLDRVMQLNSNASDLEALALSDEKTVETAEGIRLGGNTIPGAGREVEVIGRVFGMEEGEVSGPIAGSNAVFVLEVVSKSMANPDNMGIAEKNDIRNRLEEQKFMRFNQVFLDRLKEGAKITDNRSVLL
ncbi:MAG TPA: SurA N-terminal domain-containing protein [Balneolaceae bacterium]|nr:SurA N-terminal domain-containing protein [Balneolaceae bacterium]